MLSGANATLRTYFGALPYHLAGLQMIRTMLEEMGGPDAVPPPGNVIDMVSILQELTIADTTIVAGADGSFEVVRSQDRQHKSDQSPEHKPKAITNAEPESEPRHKSSAGHGNRSRAREERKEREQEEQEPQLLHSGAVLGDLPSLNSKSSPSKEKSLLAGSAVDAALGQSPGTKLLSPGGPSKRADGKQAKKKKNKRHVDEVPSDMPIEFLCPS